MKGSELEKYDYVCFSEDAYPIIKCNYGEIIEMADFARHIHGKQGEKNDDSCKYCGLDLRHPIHKRIPTEIGGKG